VRRLTRRTLARSQIKVRDLSSMSVTASPADYASWEAVRNELMAEAKKGLKARVEAEVAAAKDGDDLEVHVDGMHLPRDSTRSRTIHASCAGHEGRLPGRGARPRALHRS
jgi:hypothetical protein